MKREKTYKKTQKSSLVLLSQESLSAENHLNIKEYSA